MSKSKNYLKLNLIKKLTEEKLEIGQKCLFYPILETFDELTNVAIKEDAREKLFRLAFNYEGLKKDFSKIEDYFIEKRDAYFLTELYSAVPDDIDIDNLLRKVIETKDRDFMFDVKNHAKNIGLSDDEWKRLIDLANKIYNELEDNCF